MIGSIYYKRERIEMNLVIPFGQLIPSLKPKPIARQCRGSYFNFQPYVAALEAFWTERNHIVK